MFYKELNDYDLIYFLWTKQQINILMKENIIVLMIAKNKNDVINPNFRIKVIR